MATPLTPLRNAPLVLVIRDGWGQNPHAEHDKFNAVKLARTPVAQRLMRDWPTTLIKTCGEDVGLPPGVMGNSEVGHQNIGAGRIVDQELMRITRTIRDGSFFTNNAMVGAFEHAKKTRGCVHLLGLVSDGKVHSDIRHLSALIDLSEQLKFSGERLFVHVITDGRDVAPTSALDFIQMLENKLAYSDRGRIGLGGGKFFRGPRGVVMGCGRIATVMGRFYAMDRDNRWDRIALAYQVLTGRVPSLPLPQAFDRASDAVQDYYDRPTDPSRLGDEFVEPRRIRRSAREISPRLIVDGDAIIFFNFRGDRPRELTKAFVLTDAEWKKDPNGGFDRGRRIENLYYCTFTNYEQGLPVTAIAFEKPPKMPHILGQVISDRGLTQFRCAETEKFAHVTFFFNDYREEPFPGEKRELIPSPKEVSTYDQKPQMSAQGVCDAVLRRLAAADCEPLIVVNFANGDMVGHTGKLDAAIKAIEVVDACVGRIVDAALARGGSLIITADHGNAEQMWDPINNCPHTAHTTYDVPLIVVGAPFKGRGLRADGRLADIAPTVLEMMGIDQPREMIGRSLLA